jgi:hypothetical protein
MSKCAGAVMDPTGVLLTEWSLSVKVGDLVRYKGEHRWPLGAMTDKVYIVRSVIPVGKGDPMLTLLGLTSIAFSQLFEVVNKC